MQVKVFSLHFRIMDSFIFSLFKLSFFIFLGQIRLAICDNREIKELLNLNKQKTILNLKNELRRVDVQRKEEDRLKQLIRKYENQ